MVPMYPNLHSSHLLITDPVQTRNCEFASPVVYIQIDPPRFESYHVVIDLHIPRPVTFEHRSHILPPGQLNHVFNYESRRTRRSHESTREHPRYAPLSYPSERLNDENPDLRGSR